MLCSSAWIRRADPPIVRKWCAPWAEQVVLGVEAHVFSCETVQHIAPEFVRGGLPSGEPVWRPHTPVNLPTTDTLSLGDRSGHPHDYISRMQLQSSSMGVDPEDMSREQDAEDERTVTEGRDSDVGRCRGGQGNQRSGLIP